jgi:hypothetical protein
MVYCLKNRRRILPFSKTKGFAAKAKIKTEDASVHLKTLSDYFLIWIRLQTIDGFTFNGTFLFNLHVLKNY